MGCELQDASDRGFRFDGWGPWVLLSDYPRVEIDGAVGPRTLIAYQSLEKRRGHVKACELMQKLLDGYQTTYYATLAKGQANSSFIVGWLDHRVGNVPAARCSETVNGG